MMIKMSFLSLLISIILMSGCIPGPRPLTPPVAGVVFEKGTECPLPDVIISFIQYPNIHTKTDSEGRFYLKKVQHPGVIAFFGDPIPPSGTIQAIKEGYIPNTLEVFGYWRHESIWDSRKDAINVKIELKKTHENTDEL